MGDHRPFVFKSFQQMPGLVGGVQQAEVIRHFGIRERRAVPTAEAAHWGVGITGHRRQKEQGDLAGRKIETGVQRVAHHAQSIADLFGYPHA